ncbi:MULTISPECIES: MaoC family dehydratase [Nocardia]|uniref:MaoC family dehydratase n=1 Tax=Nocardia TaxID=1817 RepID=UPI001895CFE3|nr:MULTISPECIES: MaoC family dehydratase [Nocardia]MBF6347924.1 MaoC family dehydratase [Nocardia flavorosea]
MNNCQVGDRLPELEIPVTTQLVVTGAIATRDFQPVHHDRDAARAAGTKDIFMNILTTNGLVSRYITEWAGPYARLSKMKIGLGAPNFPGDCLTFTGTVDDIADDATVRVVVEGRNSLGVHVSATVQLTWAPEEVPANA